ncbi:MAG: hypothetical protein SPL05_04450 [Eubacteriales bacterium]|nr:hypothetical protein [Eubacteriales bacterium]
MIPQAIRHISLVQIKKNAPTAFLVVFFSEIFLTIIKIFSLRMLDAVELPDILLGTLPEIPASQIQTFAVLFGLTLVFTPLLSLGATNYFMQMHRNQSPTIHELLAYFKKPWFAWLSCLFLGLLYALWVAVPVFVFQGLFFLLPSVFNVRTLGLMLTLVYIFLFYARMRYFAFMYIVADGKEKNLLKIAKQSAALLKGRGLLVLSMVLFFTLAMIVLDMLSVSLVALGVLGQVISQALELLLKTFAMASFAGLYFYLNRELVLFSDVNQHARDILKQMQERGTLAGKEISPEQEESMRKLLAKLMGSVQEEDTEETHAETENNVEELETQQEISSQESKAEDAQEIENKE